MTTHASGGGSVQLGSIRNPELPTLATITSAGYDLLSGSFCATRGFRIELLTLGRRINAFVVARSL
jgi:hypothetical protein